MATGAGNGVVRVWRAEGEPAKGGVTGIAREWRWGRGRMGDGWGERERCMMYGCVRRWVMVSVSVYVQQSGSPPPTPCTRLLTTHPTTHTPLTPTHPTPTTHPHSPTPPTAVGSFALRGFCNGLALASSGRFLLAATGQEPRMGRWARDRDARNGVWVQELGEGAGGGAGGGVEEGDSGSE